MIQTGFLYRTQKGRMVSEAAYRHLGIEREVPDDDGGEQLTVTISQ